MPHGSLGRHSRARSPGRSGSLVQRSTRLSSTSTKVRPTSKTNCIKPKSSLPTPLQKTQQLDTHRYSNQNLVVEMTIKEFGGKVASVWEGLRPVTQKMLVGAMKAGETANSQNPKNYYDAHA